MGEGQGRRAHGGPGRPCAGKHAMCEGAPYAGKRTIGEEQERRAARAAARPTLRRKSRYGRYGRGAGPFCIGKHIARGGAAARAALGLGPVCVGSALCAMAHSA
eukprot:1973141-Pyramimonas_sp.AAC.1